MPKVAARYIVQVPDGRWVGAMLVGPVLTDKFTEAALLCEEEVISILDIFTESMVITAGLYREASRGPIRHISNIWKS